MLPGHNLDDFFIEERVRKSVHNFTYSLWFWLQVNEIVFLFIGILRVLNFILRIFVIAFLSVAFVFNFFRWFWDVLKHEL